MPTIKKKVKEPLEKKHTTNGIIMGIAIISLAVSIFAFVKSMNNESTTKVCSILGVDMLTQKVSMECK